MQHAQSRVRSLRWIGRCGLAALAGLIAFGVSPALPALAGTWSVPVQLPGSCGSAVAVNQAGALAAGGTFTAADGTTHVQVCTSPDGKTWQAADLGPGGTEPHGGQHPVMALSPDGHAVAVWGSAVGCPAACAYILQAAVRPPGGSWGAPVTLSTELYFGGGGVVLGMDGSGNAIAAWVGSYADASHYAVLPAGGSWGPARSCRTATSRGGAWSRPGGQPGRERRRGLCQQGRRDLGRLWHHRGRAFRAGPGGRRRLQHGLRPEGRAR